MSNKVRHFFTGGWFLLASVCLSLVLTTSAQAAAAKLVASPGSGNYKVGDKITTTISVNSDGQAINAAEANVTFSTDTLEYQSFSTSGSIFTFWTSGPNASDGSVSFSGGLSNPGYNGSSGKILTITFKVKATGTGHIWIYNGKVLANDGAGTNIYDSASGATYTIGAKPPAATPGPSAPSVKSSTHPSQQNWYNNKTVTLSWSATGSLGYAFVFDQSSDTNPSTAAVSSITSKTYENVGDGVWYFHVASKTSSGFTSAIHYKVQIDTQIPEPFSVTIAGDEASNPSPKITFKAEDKGSGIEYYRARIDGGDTLEIKSDDSLPKQRPGKHTIVVTAYDKAGNARESEASYTIVGISAPVVMDWAHLVGLLHPISFIGRSSPDDTIHVFYNKKEIESFVAKDKQVSFDTRVSDKKDKRVSAAEPAFPNEIAWQYVYNAPLLPGDHNFQFSRTNSQGAESELTTLFTVNVEASTIEILGHTIRTSYVFIFFGAVILILLLIIVWLLTRVHHLASRAGGALGSVAAHVRHLFTQTEREIEKEIDTTIPAHDLTRESIVDAKKELKEKVHDTFDKKGEALE